MPYPAGLAQAVFSFSLQVSGTQEDIAEFGLWFQTATQADPASWDAWLAELAQACFSRDRG